MRIERERVRALVKEELRKRLSSREVTHAALLEIARDVECSDDMDFPVRRPCIIEPDRPCYNSGYCKKLGH